MLEFDRLVGYSDVGVLWEGSMKTERGEIFTLLGERRGKTTLVRAISRIVDSWAGRMTLDRRDITKAPSKDVVEAGIAHEPEGHKLWPDMTVEDNLLLGVSQTLARRDGGDARREGCARRAARVRNYSEATRSIRRILGFKRAFVWRVRAITT